MMKGCFAGIILSNSGRGSLRDSATHGAGRTLKVIKSIHTQLKLNNILSKLLKFISLFMFRILEISKY